MAKYEPFNSRGELVPPSEDDLAAMSPATREHLHGVIEAHKVMAEFEADFATKQKRIEELTRTINDAENTLRGFPKVGFMDLWRAARS